ncbi:transglutaminase-like domain-containing protein, partial [Kibdelosporangium philippinense]
MAAVAEVLLESKRGTSEQFAASYVALARIVGIPVRL